MAGPGGPYSRMLAPPPPAAGGRKVNEWWWGGPCQTGTRQPHGPHLHDRPVPAANDNALSLAAAATGDEDPNDIVWRVDLGELLCNQSNPVLVSNQGRYIWCSSARVVVGHRDGSVSVAGDITTTCGSVHVGEGHGTLAGAFLAAAAAHFPASGRIPDPALFSSPQYNLWIECTYWPAQEKVLDYARQVLNHGMPPGVLMIDTNWAEHYGSFEFHAGRFPDPRAMAEELHAMGFKLMVWMTPFISPDSTTFRLAESQGYLLKDPKGRVKVTKWWDGYSALLDCLNPAAVRWFEEGLGRLQAIGIDGFKMDGGDPEYYAQITEESLPDSLRHTEAFAALGLKFDMSEYRACWKQAGTHLAQRLCDKNHAWDESGLASLMPNGVAQGLAGYAFGCPDMIGGGQYSDFYELGTLKPRLDIDPELFVRYAQVSALFPMMQFSLAPWRVLDGPHVKACARAALLHQEWGPYITKLAERAALTGEPIMRAMEYVFPNQGYHHVKGQFMLGDRLLVAPVLSPGAKLTTVRVPPGRWLYGEGLVVDGPTELTIELAELQQEDSVIEPLLWFEKQAVMQEAM